MNREQGRVAMHDRIPRKIKPFDEKQLKADLERYREMAMEMGASAAKVIPREKVYVDYRVRVKCTIPKCPEYGSSAHCPPHGLETEKVKKFVDSYRYALLVKMEIPSSTITGDDLGVMDEGGQLVVSKALLSLLKSYRKLNDIVTDIEAQAFYDGYYLSTSFTAGSCHASLCNFQECQVLLGQPCRFPLRSRPSMEGSGMNVYRMAEEAGWDIYPIGMDCNPENVAHGTLVGLVLID
jgi:predicted metal-binding protein